MTLDLYVYVVMSDWGVFFSLSRQFLAGTFFFWVSLHCAVTLYRDSLRHGWDPRFYYPSIYKKWLDGFHDDLCMLHGRLFIHLTSDSVCKYKKRWHGSLCDEQKTCWNAFWKLFCQKWYALPATNCRCVLVFFFLNCVFVTKLNELHSLEKQ